MADANDGDLGPVADDRPGRLRGAIGRLPHHFPLRQGCPSRPDAAHWARTGAHWYLFGRPAPTRPNDRAAPTLPRIPGMLFGGCLVVFPVSGVVVRSHGAW